MAAALRSMNHLRSVLRRRLSPAAGISNPTSPYATSTTPKSRPYSPTADEFHHQDNKSMVSKLPPLKGDFVPVYVAMGMICVSVSLGLYTAKQELFYSPNVRVKKKTRETVPEVEDPDKVAEEAEGFVKKSLFRKVAHIKEADGHHDHKDGLFVNSEKIKGHVESLKNVGVDPKVTLSSGDH